MSSTHPWDLMLSRFFGFQKMRENPVKWEAYLNQLNSDLKRYERALQLAIDENEDRDVISHARGQVYVARLRLELPQSTSHEGFNHAEKEIDRVSRMNWEDERSARNRWFELLDRVKAEDAPAASAASASSSFGANRRVISKSLFVKRYRSQHGCSKKEAEMKYDQVMRLVRK